MVRLLTFVQLFTGCVVILITCIALHLYGEVLVKLFDSELVRFPLLVVGYVLISGAGLKVVGNLLFK